MSAAIKSKIIKADDFVQTAKNFASPEENQREIGYNLAQATEKFLQILCEMKGLEFDEAEDLDSLFTLLEESDFSAVSSHADLIDLEPYLPMQGVVREDEKLPLSEYIPKVEDLKKLVGDTFRELY